MSKRKILDGVVISDKMDKTRVVEVISRFSHQLYKKLVIKRKRYKIHDAKNESHEGDKVKIVESRPYSKEKRFSLLEIIK